MSIITGAAQVQELYSEAAGKGWVIPCFCSENLTTTEAILAAANKFGKAQGIDNLPVTIAITCRYSHRPQAVYYTHSRRWDIGMKLFYSDLRILTEKGGPYENLRVMVHLDHVQHDDDRELLEWDLSGFSSIMYDASTLPFERNMELTARYVEKMKGRILIEGACDEIMDATGTARNAITTPDKAEEYWQKTGVNLIVANLGTEHRAGTKNLQYESVAARAIRERIGSRIVLHGTSSVPNEQVRGLYGDGVCKVNIWTALERDSSPMLFETLVKNAEKAAGKETVEKLAAEGWLGSRCSAGDEASLDYCTTTARQQTVFEEMSTIVEAYLALWYT
jgi:fructose/tagatose bisphosphate aldolase